MLTKKSSIFVALLFLAYTVGANAKLLKHSINTKVVPIRAITNKGAFIGLNRKKSVESTTPTELNEYHTNRNAAFSNLLNNKYKKLVLVAAGSLAVSYTCYKFVSKLVNYFLYSKYVTKPYPRVADTIGHVLLVNTKDAPGNPFVDKVVKPVSKLFERMALVKGFVRPGMKRVSTASVIDKDTYVVLYFTNDAINDRFKMMGMDPLKMLKKSYEALRVGGKKVAIVFVDISKNFDASYDFFKGTPYYSVPFGDFKRKSNLSMLFNVNYVPSVVVLDSEGNLVKDKCMNLFFDRITEFPWRNFKFLDVLPDYLVNGDNQPVHKSSLDGKYLGVLLFTGNPDNDKVLKKSLSDMYQYMNKATDGNFRVVTLNVGDSKAKGDLDGYNSDWLSVNSSDMPYVYSVIEYLNLNGINRFVLLDNEGKEYASNINFFNEKFYEPIWKEYSKGANRVKSDLVSLVHIFKRPLLLVLADGQDAKSLESVELELNKALSVHENRRAGSKFEMMLLTDPQKCESFRKHLKLNKNTKMISLGFLNQVMQFKGTDINQNTVLKFMDDYYNQFKYVD